MNRDVVKYMAMLAMLLNHIATIFLAPDTALHQIFIDLGYFTAPVMCYFLVEGYRYTRSKRQYGQRLLLFAAVSQIPFDMAFAKEGILQFQGFNMIFTLFLCFVLLESQERISNVSARGAAAAGLIVLSSFGDWGVLAPVYTLLFMQAYGSGEQTKKAFCIATGLFGLLNFMSRAETLSAAPNLMITAGNMAGVALAGICIVYFYNGKRMEKGKTFSKWFFYGFYPAHLLILGLIRIAA
ncbi:MAG: TraX family protein [Eubacteriales bacterium]|nr:TraX family protein [Eubacteriales bacterium]